MGWAPGKPVKTLFGAFRLMRTCVSPRASRRRFASRSSDFESLPRHRRRLIASDARLYASQGLALMGIYDHPEQQLFLRTMIGRDLAALPKDMHRMYLFGHDDVESLSPMEMTLVAAAHNFLMLNVIGRFFVDTMLREPEDSTAYRYARTALIYESVVSSMRGYSPTVVVECTWRHPRRDDVKTVHEGMKGDIDALRSSMTGTDDFIEQGGRFDEFKEAVRKLEP